MLTADRIKQCLLSQHPRGPASPVDTQSITMRIEAEERDTRLRMTFSPVSRHLTRSLWLQTAVCRCTDMNINKSCVCLGFFSFRSPGASCGRQQQEGGSSPSVSPWWLGKYLWLWMEWPECSRRVQTARTQVSVYVCMKKTYRKKKMAQKFIFSNPRIFSTAVER